MKLNTKRTVLVGFAFFLICTFWQAYDSIIPLILTTLVAAFVGQGTKQRQHKQCQHIVDGHDHAGPGLGHAEFVG